MEFEDVIRKLISQSIRRGKVHLFVSCPDTSLFSSKLVLNESLAKEVYQKIQRLKKVLKVGKPARDSAEDMFFLKDILHHPDVLTRESSSGQRTSFYLQLQKALRTALRSLGESRARWWATTSATGRKK